MNETHKLIYHPLNPEETEFYDLRSDPGELNNLAGAKPPEMRVLMDRLDRLGAFSEIMPGMLSSDVERVERLKDLGYTSNSPGSRPKAVLGVSQAK